jgi:hypothetical protein
MRLPSAQRVLVLCSVAGFGLTAPALAQLPDVAIVAATEASLAGCQYTDVQAKLMASGLFNSVAIVDCIMQTPTLQELLQYDGIISWSNVSYQSGAALGDVFADYVDAGGGVVLAVFATSTMTANRSLTGRWSMGYDVIVPRTGNTAGASSLGTVHQPGHPVMAGVNSLSASAAFRPTGTTLAQGTLLASWSDGKILAAAGTMPGRVDLGLFPPSNACSATWWDASTDGGVLLSNALRFVCQGAGGVGTNYCGPGVVNSTGNSGTLRATGSAVVANNDLTLVADDLPNNAFGYFLTSRTQGLVAQPGGSLGVLCLGGSIGRYTGPGQIQNTGTTGSFDLLLDLTQTPTPTGLVAVAVGETWNFQAWHRDSVGGAAVSNFTDGLEVDFN